MPRGMPHRSPFRWHPLCDSLSQTVVSVGAAGTSEWRLATAHDDRMDDTWDDKVKGTVKEKAGEVRDDDRQQAEGKMDQGKGQARLG